ncbi:MAG TPA: Lpg1974 family pore-forming outer membrane protein [Pirellulales bacterium]|jgi:hypothetical protein|nr:Lpg1974 family pore-forming outer membrane protein [Pirellulales bacterium]
MSCAKFLRITALCLGLATIAALARAAQPVSDYDLEPMLRRYGGSTNQNTLSDDGSAQATLQAVNAAPASPVSGSADQVSHAIFSTADDGSGQLSSRNGYQTASPIPTSMPAPLNNYNRGVRHAFVNQAALELPDDASDNSGSSQQPTRSVQAQPQRMPTRAMNSQPSSGMTNRMPVPDTSSPTSQEMIGPGMESMNSNEYGSAYSDCMNGCNMNGCCNGCGGNSCGCGGCGNSCDSCGGCGGCGNSCGGCCGDSCCFNPCGCCGWYAGADYVLVRPDFAIAQAFVQITGDPITGNENDRIIQQKYNYQSSVRAFLGYRFDCGDEINFHYWNLNDGGTLVASPTLTSAFGGQFMLRANNPGDTLVNTVGLNMNVYDIDYSKCCCFGGNPSSCNPCRCCPVWTLKYSAGVRIADVHRTDDTIQNSATPVVDEPVAGFIDASFIGAGPRVGIEGRRYFAGNRFSLFARTNFSLLLGQMDQTETIPVLNADGVTTITESLTDSHDRIIPVAEMELGGDWQVSNRLRMSAGYLLQAWWDLGEFEHVDVTDFQPITNATVLGFDGFFARVEVCF